jgi:2-hydroxycyclohexanecarboxyl-CoA dehydrogenase
VSNFDYKNFARQFDLSGRVAIVTGAGQGMGEAHARALAGCGASVAVVDINEKQATAVTEAIRKDGGVAETFACDMTNHDRVKEMVEGAVKAFGKLTILVNNVGWNTPVSFMESTPEQWQRLIAINYVSMLNSVHSVLPYMVKQNYGKIVNISSDGARVGAKGESVYDGLKAGVATFMKSMVREHARNKITFNTVCPGVTNTPLLQAIQAGGEEGKEVIARMVKQVPMRRPGEPWEVSGAVVFLASAASDFVQGQTLSVSGGLTMVG